MCVRERERERECVCIRVRMYAYIYVCLCGYVCTFIVICVHVFNIYIHSLFECFVFIVSACTSVLHVEQLMPAEDRALYLHTGAPSALPLPLSAFALLYRVSK